MDSLVKLFEQPEAKEIYMIAGWNQWADAGSISSGLPLYLIHLLNARKIGEITDDGFYLFQLPGAHHFLRPEIHLKDGYRQALDKPLNEFFYAEVQDKGLIIFLGEEPHLKVDRYVTAFLDAVQNLHVKRVAAVGGVYGEMPYDKDRHISCVYSLPILKEELNRYAVRFSNYEGGTTIGTYIVDAAEHIKQEFFVFYAFVPAYNFSEMNNMVQAVSVEHDFKAWYDLMRRFNHMFDMDIDLTELEHQSYELVLSMDAKLQEVEDQLPQLAVREYMDQVAEEFEEKPFVALSDVWGKALGSMLDEETPDEEPE
ncbi:MAG: PAC2 family protein [Anaerolineae bacterium]|nr:PAC2 family protein [Anaerolineae bacterium]